MDNQWNNNPEGNENGNNYEFSQNNSSFGGENNNNFNDNGNNNFSYSENNGSNQQSGFYNPNEYAFKNVIDNGKRKTMGWSVASMVLGIISVVCCCFGWSGLILGTMAIVFSVVSRKSLEYFDGMSIAGLVLGIFGLVFGVAMIIGTYLPPDSYWNSFFEEFESEFNNGTIPGAGGQI